MKIKNTIEKICKYPVLIISVLLLALLSLLSIVFTSEISYDEVLGYHLSSVLNNVIALILPIALGFLYYKYIKHKSADFISKNGNKIFCILLLSMTSIYALFILCTLLPPRADQLICFDVAKSLIDNALNDNYTVYLQKYPNQQGLILYFVLIQKLFGKGNFLIVQFINLIFAVVGCIYSAKLFKSLNIIENKKILTLVLLLYTPFIFYITFVYGNIIGYTLAVAAVYCQIKYINNNKFIYACVSVVLFSLSAILKSNYLIFLVAGVILLIFNLLYTKKLRFLVLTILTISFYMLSNFCISASLEKISQTNLDSGMPAVAWVTMGLQEGELAPGWYNGYIQEAYQEGNTVTQEVSDIAVSDLKERLSYFKEHPKYTAEFFSKKIISGWCEPTFESLWIQNDLDREISIEQSDWIKGLLYSDNLLNKLYVNIFDIVQTFVYVFSLLYFIINYKKITFYQLIPVIIFIGGFIFHTFWEMKGQYTIVYFFLLIPYALKGFKDILSFIVKKTA